MKLPFIIPASKHWNATESIHNYQFSWPKEIKVYYIHVQSYKWLISMSREKCKIRAICFLLLAYWWHRWCRFVLTRNLCLFLFFKTGYKVEFLVSSWYFFSDMNTKYDSIFCHSYQFKTRFSLNLLAIISTIFSCSFFY